MRLPPGVNEKDFADAIRQFEEVVGLDWVFTSDEDLDTYRDGYSPYQGESEERIASAAVAPDDVEEVSKVVKIANAYRIPIYAISTGRDMGYGHCAPAYSGSVVLDLKRMDRIIEVSETNAYCVVEPGVNYFDMYRYLQEKGIRLILNLPDANWGGLIGNSLDHGNGYMLPEYRDHFGSHCGMEVVLANGEIMRTGMGAIPDSKVGPQYKYGLGPYVDGIFSQGNYGVVTKMGFWMYPMPEGYFRGTVQVPRHDDLHRLVEIMSYLLDSGISNGFSSVGAPVLRSAGVTDLEHLALIEKLDARNLSPEFEKYALRKGVAYWSGTLSFYGPVKVMKAQWEYAKEKLSAIPGATFQEGDTIRFPVGPDYFEKAGTTTGRTPCGIPTLTTFGQSIRGRNPTPTMGHVWFSPVIPRTGEAIFELNRVFGQYGAETGFPQFSPSSFRMPMDFLGNRVFLALFGFKLMADVEYNRKVRAVYREAARLGAEHGWSEYRSCASFYDDLMVDFSYNNHSLMCLHETVKDAVDPNGILSAGRYGLWPKHLRHMKDAKRS